MTLEALRFSRVHDERVRRLFSEAYRGYIPLRGVSVTLEQRPIKGSSMRAQPCFGLSGVDGYRVQMAEFVRDSDALRLDALPDDVLKGWFAHELGHVLDYRSYGFWGMLWYGFRYLSSNGFRREKEHRADTLALEHGFHREIMAAKRFLFEHEGISMAYRGKMEALYMSTHEVQAWIKQHVDIDPVD